MPARMLDDIAGQPLSLAEASAWQFGEGAPAIEAAALALRDARRIVFTGMGSSLFAAIPAAALLQSRGIAAEAIETSELLHFLHPSLQPGVAVVVVSRSGESVEAVKLLSLLRGRGLALVGLTNVPGSTLAHESTHPLLMKCRPDRMVAVQSYSSSLAVLLLLAAAVLRDPPGPWQAAIASTGLALEAGIRNQTAANQDWAAFLSGVDAVYLLGRGPSLASCHEGALLFHEACRVPAVAMSAGQFRHGPVEVVDSRTRAIIFASQPATRDLDLALAADLRSMGAQVRVCRGDCFAAGLETILEIVAVQLAACHLAEAKGWEPGDFRHASLVTASESGFPQLP